MYQPQQHLDEVCRFWAAATAFGKTVVGAGFIAARKVNTLVLVHRQQLVSQWQERLGQFLVINERPMGRPGLSPRSAHNKQ